MRWTLQLLSVALILFVSNLPAQENVLEPGYGMTIGNSLRRVLLSGLEGRNISSPTVQHAFAEIRFIDFDVLDPGIRTLGTDFGGGLLTTTQVSSGNEIGHYLILNFPRIKGHWEDYGHRGAQAQLPANGFSTVFKDQVGLQSLIQRHESQSIGFEFPLLTQNQGGNGQFLTEVGLGFDFLTSRQGLDYQTQPGGVFPDAGRVQIETNNKAFFVGTNVGGTLTRSRTQFSVKCNFGFGTNSAEKELNTINPIVNGGSIPFSTSETKNALAFKCVFDASVMAVILRNVSVRGGYRVVGYSGIATAANQLPDVFDNLSTVDTAGGEVYHGAYLGISLTTGVPNQGNFRYR